MALNSDRTPVKYYTETQETDVTLEFFYSPIGQSFLNTDANLKPKQA